MGSYWESVASRSDGQHTEADLEIAVYRLVTEQVLYHADRSNRTAYYAVERFERDMRIALSPLGIEVGVNRNLRYVYAIPKHGKAGTASASQTVFALVLRQIYDERIRLGDLNDDGEVYCGLVELGEKYRLLVGRDLPGRGDLDSLMRITKRWGIARKENEASINMPESDLEGQPYIVVIRPAIVDVLGEAALMRLALWTKTSDDSLNEGDTNTPETQEKSEKVSE
jgi:hypothetical protein